MGINQNNIPPKRNSILHTMDCGICGEDDFYWDLLEEKHNHDVVISGAVEGGEEDDAAGENS